MAQGTLLNTLWTESSRGDKLVQLIHFGAQKRTPHCKETMSSQNYFKERETEEKAEKPLLSTDARLESRLCCRLSVT